MTIYYFKVVFWNGAGWQARLIGDWPTARRAAGRGERILALGG